MSEKTVCTHCKFLWRERKNDPWYRWMCGAAPLPQWFNPVTGLTVADPPKQLAKLVNRGECPMFERAPHPIIIEGDDNAC